MKFSVVFALALFLSLPGTAAHAQGQPLIPPTVAVAGVSQVEWSARWWQWAFSFADDRSPVADRTGARCASRQGGEVWFLAGTYGSRRVERECVVPAGRTLFFPLINFVAYRAEGGSESCMSLAARAAALTDDPSALILEIDGVRFEGLAAHRMATPCFPLEPGTRPDAVGNGYFVAVGPLPKGQHVLNFGGILPQLRQAVTYRITVE